MSEFVEFVQRIGFPMAVAAVLLWDRLTISRQLLAVLHEIKGILREDRIKVE